jgi:uncharacterized membrane protein
MSINVLLVGESWVSSSTHFKGFDFFVSANYEIGSEHLTAALEKSGISVKHLPAHEAARHFPVTVDGLKEYQVVILSDIGANTLLLHPDTFLHGKRTPNRLEVIADYVRAGGGLLMAGGYLSFQGIYGSARYRKTAVEEVLPVRIHAYDDRVEAPEGVVPTVVQPEHPAIKGIDTSWPYLLGYNEVEAKEGGSVLLRVKDDPLLVVGAAGEGRVAAWTSDVGPHWCPPDFFGWDGYTAMFGQLVTWLAGASG